MSFDFLGKDEEGISSQLDLDMKEQREMGDLRHDIELPQLT